MTEVWQRVTLKKRDVTGERGNGEVSGRFHLGLNWAHRRVSERERGGEKMGDVDGIMFAEGKRRADLVIQSNGRCR